MNFDNLIYSKKRWLFLSLSSYFLISVIIFFLINGEISKLFIDFNFYHGYAFQLLGENVSDLSRSLFSESHIREGWIPSPFYSVVFTLPITIFGSQFLLYLLGLSIGILFIFSSFKILDKPFLNHINENHKGFILLLISINPYFILDSLGVSSMSVGSTMILFAFANNNSYIRAIFFSMAAAVRPNFGIAYIGMIISILVFRPKNNKFLIRDSIPSLFVYTFFYIISYSSYQGNNLNYLFLTEGQGIDFLNNYSESIVNEIEGSKIEDILYWNPSPFRIIKFLTLKPKVFNYLFHIFLFKLSGNLGFLYDEAFKSEIGLWFFKPLRSLYFLIFTLPSFYCSIISLFVKNKRRVLKAINLFVLLFIIFNSALIAVPRYLIGIHIFLYLSVANLFSYRKRKLTEN